MGKAFSTITVYLEAISACHVGFGNKLAEQHPLMGQFMNCKRPVSRPLVPHWDLALVLDSLFSHPIESLKGVGLQFLLIKTALLVGLTTARCVSDMQAFSVRPSCLQFDQDYTSALIPGLYLK